MDESRTPPDRTEQSGGAAIVVRREPAMQLAVELLQTLVSGGRMTLKASGSSIPNAVAVANIMTESTGDGVRAEDIRVDSEAPPGIGRMVSTIEIVLVRD